MKRLTLTHRFNIVLVALFMGLSMMMSSPSWAQEKAVSKASVDYFISAPDLKTYCFSAYDTDFGYCAGYVTGVADLMHEHTIYGFETCNMQMVKSQQMVDIVKNFMNKNPGQVKGNARYLVAQALSKSFPCF